jgi:hypothetical protein
MKSDLPIRAELSCFSIEEIGFRHQKILRGEEKKDRLSTPWFFFLFALSSLSKKNT